MFRKNKHLRNAAAESHTAAEKGAAAIDHAAAALNQTLAALSTQVSSAQEKVAPIAKQAVGKTIEAAENARTHLEPRLVGAYAAVSPSIDTARHKVQEDLVPRLTELLHEAENHPAFAEAQKRGTAALASLKGELAVPVAVVPVKKQKSAGKRAAKLLAISALLAGAAVAVRQFLLSKDDGWTAHEPSPAYTPPTRPEDEIVFTTTTPAATATESAAAEDVTEEVPITDAPEAEVAEALLDEDAPLDEQAATAADAGSYGENSYVGSEPPEGYVIKGNERSRKYHVPDSGGYARTIADVWFNSEEAAQAAGFSKAQR